MRGKNLQKNNSPLIWKNQIDKLKPNSLIFKNKYFKKYFLKTNSGDITKIKIFYRSKIWRLEKFFKLFYFKIKIRDRFVIRCKSYQYNKSNIRKLHNFGIFFKFFLIKMINDKKKINLFNFFLKKIKKIFIKNKLNKFIFLKKTVALLTLLPNNIN